MELTFTKRARDFLASFETVDGDKTLYYRIGLVEGKIWLAMEQKGLITQFDTFVAGAVTDQGTKLSIYCNEEDLDILRGTTVDFELHGLSKRICFKDPRFGRVLFAGDIHPALAGE